MIEQKELGVRVVALSILLSPATSRLTSFEGFVSSFCSAMAQMHLCKLDNHLEQERQL